MILGLEGIFTPHAEGKLSLCQPVGHLRKISAEGDIHAAEKTLNKLGTQLGVKVEELHRGPKTRVSRIQRNDFASPLRIEKVPVGLELLGIHKLRIEGKLSRAWVRQISKDIFAVRICVAVLAAIPLRWIDDLWKNQRGLDRIQRLAFVKNIEISVGAPAVDVGDEFVRPPFGDNPGGQRGSSTRNGHYFNVRVVLLKLVQQPFVPIDIDCNLTLLLSGREDRLPFFAPVRLCERIADRPQKDEEGKADKHKIKFLSQPKNHIGAPACH